MSRIAVIDSQVAGISGDMLLSGLVDAGANKDKVIDAIFSCQNFLKGSKISAASFAKTMSHGFSATEFKFAYKDSVRKRSGLEMYRSLASCCDSMDLEQRAKTFALESLKTIISAEAKIHGEEFNKVHLHESSSIDTLADLVGCAVALQDLKLFDARIFSTKVAVGGGILEFSHGKVPNPAGAILEIFKGRPFTLVSGQAEEELTTPTGAAMLVNLASGSSNFYPSISPEAVGYGAGRKKLAGVANVLRILIGKSRLVDEAGKDTVCLIETNVDDATGEMIGNLIEQLNEAKAKDVTVIAGTSKKGRPTYLIRIISDPVQLNDMLEILFKESGTLGARVQELERFVLPRAVLTVPVNIMDNQFNVQIKVVKDSTGQVTNVKPEFEDVKTIAARLGISVRKAMELVNAEVMTKVGRL